MLSVLHAWAAWWSLPRISSVAVAGDLRTRDLPTRARQLGEHRRRLPRARGRLVQDRSRVGVRVSHPAGRPAGSATGARWRSDFTDPPHCESPLRARGRLRAGALTTQRRRRIPARAGSTSPSRSAGCGPREDPRARRVDRTSVRYTLSRVGGSPRAGSAATRGCTCSTASEDPRACGANIAATAVSLIPLRRSSRAVDARISGAVFAASGGSPRARGRRGALGALVAGAGRIPACAGPTLAELRSYRPVCQFLQLFSVRRHRARDKVNHLASQLTYPPACTVSTATHSDSATISACAGPTSSSAGESPNRKEYPRRRGVDRRCSELRAL